MSNNKFIHSTIIIQQFHISGKELKISLDGKLAIQVDQELGIQQFDLRVGLSTTCRYTGRTEDTLDGSCRGLQREVLSSNRCN